MFPIHSLLSVVLATLPATGASQAAEEKLPPARAIHIVALYDAGPAWVPDLPPLQQPGIQAHAAYMDKLSAEGTLALGGPLFADLEPPEISGALLVINAESLEAARAIVTADPALEAGLLKLKELRHFVVYVGGVAPTPGSQPRAAQ